MVNASRTAVRGPRIAAASRVRAGAALALAALMLAGCRASGPLSAADARNAVLRPDDVPAGYTARRHRELPELSDADIDRLVACTKIARSFVVGDEPHADSPDFATGRFASGPAQLVASRVMLARSSDDLRESLTRLADGPAVHCFEPYFRVGFEQDLGSRPTVTMSNFAVRPLDVGRIGDQAAAFQGTVTMNTAGGPVQQDLDLYFVRSGRALVTVRAAGFDAPFDRHLAENLLSTIASRL